HYKDPKISDQIFSDGLSKGSTNSVAIEIADALKLYPNDLTESAIDEIYIGRNLKISTKDASGKTERVSVPGVNLQNSQKIILEFSDDPLLFRKTIHHEIAHKLLETYPMYFDQKTWANLDPAADEDAKIAENLFVYDPLFWDRVNHSKKLEKKVNFIIQFYHQLDPQFTKAYFETQSLPWKPSLPIGDKN
ncbi:MAG: hypothetical protein JWQ35_2514, partial [Bacteriovoracaceae bacterium]|nr:hypothetical protein [Bacteriovoracaceae bacterium]